MSTVQIDLRILHQRANSLVNGVAGADLDALGATYSTPRLSNEIDSDYSARIVQAILSQLIADQQ